MLLVKLQAEACNFAKSSAFLWVFFTFFKLCKWYQNAQNVSYICDKELKGIKKRERQAMKKNLQNYRT